MPKNLFNNLQDANSYLFRYLLYLSRGNRWIAVGGDVYQLTIKDIVKDATRYENGKPSYYHEHEAIHEDNSSEKEDNLKLKLSRSEFSRTALEGGYHDGYAGEYRELVEPLNLNIDAHFYHRLAVSYYEIDKQNPKYLDNQFICICLFAENYDEVFSNKLDAAKTDEERKQMIANYDEQKKFAEEEAIKNPIWLAAASGDNELLADLLEDETNIDLNSTFKGKTILNAMLDGTAAFTYIIPNYNNKIDYAATLDTLLKHGLDKSKLQQFYDAHTSGNQHPTMYAKPVDDQNGLLPIIQTQLSVQQNISDQLKASLQN